MLDSSSYLKNEKNGVRYLGYFLPLGRSELSLLRALILCDGPLSTDELSKVSGVFRSNIFSTVKRINEKAGAIGGRLLILSGRSTGYYLNPNL